jgi:hypothetical protein
MAHTATNTAFNTLKWLVNQSRQKIIHEVFHAFTAILFVEFAQSTSTSHSLIHPLMKLVIHPLGQPASQPAAHPPAPSAQAERGS